MLKLLRSLVAGATTPSDPVAGAATDPEAPAVVAVDGAQSFPFARHVEARHGFPIVDWTAVGRWIESIADPATKARAWSEAELAWVRHVRAALGAGYRITRLDEAVLLSTLEPRVARATVEFMARVSHRIARVLDGLARFDASGHDILIVFDDVDAYDRYVSIYYPDSGEFATSGGMYIGGGCGHFVTMKSDLRVIEPVIAHEMTHAGLAHLPLPAWLNEGIAVNTEGRLSPSPALEPPAQMHVRHRAFWGPGEIQAFWSGKSFLRPDASALSYDLARILVDQFAKEWDAFRAFVLAANVEDAGRASALEHLGIDLGRAVCAILERRPSADWSPDPARWEGTPERGAFYGRARLARGASIAPRP